MFYQKFFALSVLAVAVTACGGGSAGSGSGSGNNGAPGGTSPVVVAPPPSLRGSLVGGPAAVSTFDAQALKQLVDSAQSGASSITSTPLCAVSTYTVRYRTIGSAGEDTEASTAIMLPSGADPACTGPRP
eukprot:gene41214-51017_t